MNCPFCAEETKVLESRQVENSIRRRRECLECAQRFTTYEEAFFQLTVMKKDGRVRPFDPEKITQSLFKACNKTDSEVIREAGRKIERKLLAKHKAQISSKEIGKFALQELKKIDQMAYVRFATIHKGIDSTQALKKEVRLLA